MPSCYPVFRWIVMRLIIQNLPRQTRLFKQSMAPTNINLTSPIDDDSIFMAFGGMYAARVEITEDGGYHNERQVGVIEVKRSVDVTSQGHGREWFFECILALTHTNTPIHQYLAGRPTLHREALFHHRRASSSIPRASAQWRYCALTDSNPMFFDQQNGFIVL